ncbi:MAG TPA: hypothetical protein DHV59_03570 [Oxalobacteraceae bacterium]|nr:hypothetical protein [Oxalobacteraceae bacterium]
MSAIGWVDFSSTDRELVSKIIDMLAEPGTLDEIGIGQIRDAFSDTLFPGFSTIQTRARYFLAVPQIFRDYLRLSAKEKRRRPFHLYLKDCENQLAQSLVDNHKGREDDLRGIIGSTLVGKGGVARLPSSIYWNGLKKFRIVNTELSLSEFCRSMANIDDAYVAVVEDKDGEDDRDALRRREIVRLTPIYDDGWISKAVLPLTRKEAEFLRDQIRFSPAMTHSVPAQLLEVKLLDKAINGQFTTFEQLADWLNTEEKISAQCRAAIGSAQEFSRMQIGAQIRLDCLVAKRHHQDDRLKQWEDEYARWEKESRQQGLFQRDATDSWLKFTSALGIKVRPKTVAFLRNWNVMMHANSKPDELDALVEKRCLDNKKEHSVLRRSPSKDIGQIGTRALDYRWLQTQRILRDISEGLKC